MRSLTTIILLTIAMNVGASGYDRETRTPETSDSNSDSSAGSVSYSGSLSDASAYNQNDVDIVINNNITTGTDGTDGADVTSYSADTNDYSYNSSEFSKQIASMSAMANIPHLSHNSVTHGHTGVGVGVGLNDGYAAMAIGLMHDFEKVAVKGSISKAEGAEETYGVGATLSW